MGDHLPKGQNRMENAKAILGAILIENFRSLVVADLGTAHGDDLDGYLGKDGLLKIKRSVASFEKAFVVFSRLISSLI